MRRFALPLLIALVGCDVWVPVPVSETVPVPVSAPVPMPVSEPTEGPPIPQDPIMMKKRSADWLAWNRQTLGDAYGKIGKKSPKWDKAAEETLELAARMYSLQLDPFTQPPDVYPVARRAVDAGCADPLVLYVYARTSMEPNFPGNKEYRRRFDQATDALLASDYSPFRKASSLLKSGQADEHPTPDQTKATEARLDQIFDLLASSVKADPRGEFWEMLWHDNLQDLLSEYRRLNPDSKTAFDKFDARLARVAGVEGIRLAIRGRFFVDYAWEARTNAFAPQVTDQQFQSFGQRLTEARTALEAAYKLNPRQPNVARTMLTVELGDSDDRASMELWFKRALELNPLDRAACVAKMTWLEPKWHGDPEGKEMLDFGKACAATGNWVGGITLVLADSLIDYAACTLAGAEQAQFFRRPDNWNASAQVFDEYLKHYPTSYTVLSKYAFLAYASRQVQIAHGLFQRLGDNLTTWSEDSSPPIATLRQARDIIAKATGTIPKPANSPK